MDNLIVWSPGVTLEAVEQQVIEKAMVHFRGNQLIVANSLGIAPRTLYNKLKEYEALKGLEADAAKDRRQDRETFLKRCRGELIEPQAETITDTDPTFVESSDTPRALKRRM